MNAIDLILTILLPLQMLQADAQAELIAANEYVIVDGVSPQLASALERLTKRKGYYYPGAFYQWTTEEYIQCNLDFVRQYYYMIDILPPLSHVDGLPSFDYCLKQYQLGSQYQQNLDRLATVAPPWEQDNISLLKSEGQILQNCWSLAYRIHERKDNPLQCRLLIQQLEVMLGDNVFNIWGVPPVPMWRLEKI